MVSQPILRCTVTLVNDVGTLCQARIRLTHISSQSHMRCRLKNKTSIYGTYLQQNIQFNTLRISFTETMCCMQEALLQWCKARRDPATECDRAPERKGAKAAQWWAAGGSPRWAILFDWLYAHTYLSAVQNKVHLLLLSIISRMQCSSSLDPTLNQRLPTLMGFSQPWG
jgi:hypothetical protein